MVKEFISQNYLIIQNNLVVNVCVWDGDTSKWTPPQGSIALVQATTSCMVWQSVIVDGKISDYVLGEQTGVGDIGFSWDGTNCITNQPKPQIPTTITA